MVYVLLRTERCANGVDAVLRFRDVRDDRDVKPVRGSTETHHLPERSEKFRIPVSSTAIRPALSADSGSLAEPGGGQPGDNCSVATLTCGQLSPLKLSRTDWLY